MTWEGRGENEGLCASLHLQSVNKPIYLPISKGRAGPRSPAGTWVHLP